MVRVFDFEQVIYFCFLFRSVFSLCALNTPITLRHVEHAGKIIPGAGFTAARFRHRRYIEVVRVGI